MSSYTLLRNKRTSNKGWHSFQTLLWGTQQLGHLHCRATRTTDFTINREYKELDGSYPTNIIWFENMKTVERNLIEAQMRINLLAMATAIVLSFLILGCLKKTPSSSLSQQETCLVTQGNQCQFPFIFNGNIYTGCTRDGASDNKSWCSTNINLEGFHQEGYWGYCNEACPQSVSGVPINIKGNCPNQLLAEGFELSYLNGIYLLSEFGLKNGQNFYTMQTDSNNCIWWQTEPANWIIGSCGEKIFSIFNSSQNCTDNFIDKSQEWMILDSMTISHGRVIQMDNSTKQTITPVAIEKKMLFWKSTINFDWAASCRFQTDQTTMIYTTEIDCRTRCYNIKSCTHVDWCYNSGGQCILREGNVSRDDAKYVTDLGFTCSIVKRN